MTIILWIVGATLVLSVIVWRLRRASQTLSTILRDERERTIIDGVTEVTTEPPRQRKPQPSPQHTAPPADK